MESNPDDLLGFNENGAVKGYLASDEEIIFTCIVFKTNRFGMN